MTLKELKAALAELVARLERLRKRYPGDQKKRRKARLAARIEDLQVRIANRLRRKQEHRVIPRSEWGAPPPNNPPSRMSNDNQGLFVHHTVAGNPATRTGEEQEMRNLDAIAKSRGFNYISYSFVIASSGRIYEGRGRGVEGAHTIGYNDTAHGAAAMGNYEVNQPTDEMVAAYRWLRRQYLGAGSDPLRPHGAVSSTACPGKNLRNRMGEM